MEAGHSSQGMGISMSVVGQRIKSQDKEQSILLMGKSSIVNF